MDENEILEDAEQASKAIAELVKAAGSSPRAKAAADNLGKTAVTITETINNVLLPLAAVNYAFDKARIYFSERFSYDMEEKIREIPEERRVEPDPIVAGPALQGLAYGHESADLRGMFLSLLASSIDSASSELTHPAYVDTLRQITSFEAQLIGGLFEEPITPIASVVLISEAHYDIETPIKPIPLEQHLLNISDSETGQLSDDPRIKLMVDNFERLGLIKVSYSSSLKTEKDYEWAIAHPLYSSLYNKQGRDGKLVSNDGKYTFQVGLNFGVLELTPYGKSFSVAAGIVDSEIYTNEA